MLADRIFSFNADMLTLLSFLYFTDFLIKGGFSNDRKHMTDMRSEMQKSPLNDSFKNMIASSGNYKTQYMVMRMR